MNLLPKRQRTKRYSTEHLMGPGSYVVIKTISIGEAMAIEDAAKPPEMQPGMSEDEWQQCLDEHEEKVKHLNFQAMADCVVEWNWVDDNDTPLPQPRSNPEVFALLTPPEIDFIADKMGGETKNKKK